MEPLDRPPQPDGDDTEAAGGSQAMLRGVIDDDELEDTRELDEEDVEDGSDDR